jgi:hypothetical protein
MKQNFQNDSNHYFGIDGENNNSPVLVTEKKEIVGMENPYFIALAQKNGLYSKQFNFTDEDYSNAFGDKLKKGAKNVGGRIGNAVKDTVKDPKKAIKNLGKDVKKGADQLKDAVKEGGEKLLNAAKKVALAIPRQAFLGMVALNFGGIATRYNLKTAEGKKQIEDKWEKLGGEPGSFRGSVTSGEKKKPLILSKKKRAALYAETNKASATGQKANNFVGFDPATDTMIAAGSSILAAILPVVLKAPSANPSGEAELDKEQATADAQDGALNTGDVAAINEFAKAQRDEIINNPNLTPEEKQAILKELDAGGGKSWFKKNIWLVVIGIIGISAIGYYALKGKKQA